MEKAIDIRTEVVIEAVEQPIISPAGNRSYCRGFK